MCITVTVEENLKLRVNSSRVMGIGKWLFLLWPACYVPSLPTVPSACIVKNCAVLFSYLPNTMILYLAHFPPVVKTIICHSFPNVFYGISVFGQKMSRYGSLPGSQPAETPKYMIIKIGSWRPQRFIWDIATIKKGSSLVGFVFVIALISRLHQSYAVNVKLLKEEKTITKGWIRVLSVSSSGPALSLSVSGSRLEGTAGEESLLRLRALFILPEAQQPYGGWLTQRCREGRYLYAKMIATHHRPYTPLQLRSLIAHLACVSLPTFLLSRCALSSNWCLSLQDRGSGHL